MLIATGVTNSDFLTISGPFDFAPEISGIFS